jgi:hypothetical protein
MQISEPKFENQICSLPIPLLISAHKTFPGPVFPAWPDSFFYYSILCWPNFFWPISYYGSALAHPGPPSSSGHQAVTTDGAAASCRPSVAVTSYAPLPVTDAPLATSSLSETNAFKVHRPLPFLLPDQPSPRRSDHIKRCQGPDRRLQSAFPNFSPLILAQSHRANVN